MEVIKGLNEELRFLLELCVLAALGYWGFHAARGTVAKVGLAALFVINRALMYSALAHAVR